MSVRMEEFRGVCNLERENDGGWEEGGRGMSHYEWTLKRVRSEQVKRTYEVGLWGA